ncbi:MAG: hypothetical protein AAGF20_01860 [Pseudomonadota bacterium]
MIAPCRSAILSIVLLAVPTLTACVSAREVDTEAAFQKCRTKPDKKQRDLCIADALANAERSRLEERAEIIRRQEEAEKRELERAKAGVKPD